MSLRPVLLASATLFALAAAAPLAAQTGAAAIAAQTGAGDPAKPPRDGGPPVAAGDIVTFEADTVHYDDNTSNVTALGDVRLARDAWQLRADSVDYNRTTGAIIGTGHVVSVDPQGNQAFGDRIELSDSLRDGLIDNVLLVLDDGGRVAALQGLRNDNIITLRRAVYSPCIVVDDKGCPHQPVWEIKASRLSYNRDRHRLTYKDASLDVFGVPLLYLPTFSNPDGEAERAGGLLLPEVGYSRLLGFGLGLPYHIPVGPDRDITITPHFYSGENPALQLSARRLLRDGPIQFDAFFTYAQLVDYAPDGVTQIDRGDQFRGYFALKGQLQHSPEWRSTFSVRITTDKTFDIRYNLDYDDTLRSTYALERVTSDSYLSISGWGFQGLRPTDTPGEIPFVLPLIEYDWRPTDTVLGGHVQVVANSMDLLRTGGQSVQRALAYGRWDRSVLTSLGQRITFTAMARGDLYNTTDPQQATLPEYAGLPGLHGRIYPLGAVDAEWPFTGPALGGTQTITPRIQVVSLPSNLNGGIPNEDSRAIELEDTSLFDLNRFPGYDRVEGGTRFTWGLEYALNRPGWELRSEFGESIRLAGLAQDFPDGTGLSSQFSDFVGRTSLKIGRHFEITHRFRIDNSSLAVRRNEIDVTIGDSRNYVTVGYLKLNRNIQIEDLEDRTELRAGARVALSRYWSAFGSAIVDLTPFGVNTNPLNNGFQPIRHRVGFQYEDECFRIGVTWRRDYITVLDVPAGNSFLLTFAFKTSRK